MSNKTERTYR